MLSKIKHIISKYAYIYLPILTLLCLAGFIGSYLFPNKVLDTYKVNHEEKDDDVEFVQIFTGTDNEIGYAMETDGRPMKGIQIGICKNGAMLDGTELVYRVYRLDDSEKAIDDCLADSVDVSTLALLDEEVYNLSECLDGQYPYLPFGNDLCSGKLYVTFTYLANGCTEPAPGMFMNHAEIPHVATYVDGAKEMDGEDILASLKCYYIYTHDTYPFLYDARVMLCIFLAASACVTYPALAKKNTKSDEEAEKEAGEEDTAKDAEKEDITEEEVSESDEKTN